MKNGCHLYEIWLHFEIGRVLEGPVFDLAGIVGPFWIGCGLADFEAGMDELADGACFCHGERVDGWDDWSDDSTDPEVDRACDLEEESGLLGVFMLPSHPSMADSSPVSIAPRLYIRSLDARHGRFFGDCSAPVSSGLSRSIGSVSGWLDGADGEFQWGSRGVCLDGIPLPGEADSVLVDSGLGQFRKYNSGLIHGRQYGLI